MAKATAVTDTDGDEINLDGSSNSSKACNCGIVFFIVFS
jgi:hypothetical protein